MVFHMKQVTKNQSQKIKRPTKRKTVKHRLPGTSKLEERFAKEFLDKLDIKYIYQFEVKEIGRFYDFALFPPGGGIILLEIDGSYYHSDPRLVKEEDMNPMQKRNKRVDEYKNKWALSHGIPIIRIWEKDINESPSKVFDALKKKLYIENDKKLLTEKKNKRHINKIK